MNTRVDMGRAKNLLKERMQQRMAVPGNYESGLEGVRTFRRDATTKPGNCFYRPTIIKVVQGYKRVRIGAEEYQYGEDDVLVSGVDMHGVSMVCQASPEAPGTSIAIDLDKNILTQLALEIPYEAPEPSSVIRGLHVQPMDSDMLDAFVRLADLMSSPQRLAILGPMVVREIHYLLLTGPSGFRLRTFHTMGSQNHQVAQAISWLKRNIATSIQIEELAEKVHMAPSTFHRHFKEVTALSPLQYQKRLRLHEAQRLMLVDYMDASSASIAVGYESHSQFTREYKRLFGEPPRKDVEKLRRATFTGS